jgi:hypothetical protein
MQTHENTNFTKQAAINFCKPATAITTTTTKHFLSLEEDDNELNVFPS